MVVLEPGAQWPGTRGPHAPWPDSDRVTCFVLGWGVRRGVYHRPVNLAVGGAHPCAPPSARFRFRGVGTAAGGSPGLAGEPSGEETVSDRSPSDPRNTRRSKGRTPRRRRRGPSGPDDLPRVRDLVRRLDALARDLLRRELAGQAPTRPVGPLPLEVELRPGSGADEKRRAADLLAELKQRVAEIGDGVVPFRPGRVYCFWCRSNACEHGRPGSPREVFIGYDPTGRPRFTDFGRSGAGPRRSAHRGDLFRSAGSGGRVRQRQDASRGPASRLRRPIRGLSCAGTGGHRLPAPDQRAARGAPGPSRSPSRPSRRAGRTDGSCWI